MELNYLKSFNDKKLNRKINIYNDGKEKHESYEAHYINSEYDINIAGYGKDESESIENLYILLKDVIACISEDIR